MPPAAQPPVSGPRRWLAGTTVPVILVGLLGTAASFLAARSVYLGVRRGMIRECEGRARVMTQRVSERLESHRQILQGAAGLFDASDDGVQRHEWRAYARRIFMDSRLSGVQGLGFAAYIPSEGRAAHEMAVRREGFPDYRIQPEGERSIGYGPIVYLEPFEGRNLRAFGFDMLSEATRRAAMEQARDTAQAVLSAPVTLVQETGEDVQTGILMYLPVYRQGAPQGNFLQRRDALKGWVYSPFRTGDLLRTVFEDAPLRPDGSIRLRITDADPGWQATPIFDSQAGQPAGTGALPIHQTLTAQGRTWYFQYEFQTASLGAGEFRRAATVLLAGLALSGLLAALVGAILRARRHMETQARTLQELALSRALYQSLVDALPLSLYRVDMHGGLQFLNATILRAFGTSLEHWVGRSASDLHLTPMAGRNPNDDARVFHGETLHRVEDLVDPVTGALQKVEIVKVPVRDGQGNIVGLQGIYWDVTDKVEAEARLRESERRFRALMEGVQLAGLMLDLSGRVTFANTWLLELIGATRADILGVDWFQHYVGEGAEEARSTFQRIIEGHQSAMRHQHPVCLADGTSHQLAWNSTVLLDENRRPCGMASLGQDITEQARAEEERRRLEAQLQRSQRMESLGNLAGGVAHDMNNVLGAILGLSTSFQAQAPEGSPLAKGLGTISRACERGRTMVRGLLDFARQGIAEQHDLDLNALIREEVRLLERTTLSRIQFHLDLAPDLPPLRGDASALTHAFMNLCVNAVDAMPEGGTLTLATRLVPGNQLEVRVTDTGTGMPPEVLEKAMEPFYTTKPQGKGTGLGLAMVYGTVKAHRGQLELQSQPGFGTTVLMRFPAAAPGSTEPEPGPEREVEGMPPFHVLLVDDDELVRTSMEMQLQVLGCHAILATSGEEALERATVDAFDLVILDMNMPGLGGVETLPRLRDLCPTTPILLATGRATPEAQKLAEAHGADILAKPFSLQELRERLLRMRRECLS